MKLWSRLSITTVTFLLFALVAWWAGSWLGLEGRDLWILRTGLIFLGLIAAVLIYLFLARRARALAASGAGLADDEIDAAIATARARLRDAGLAGKARLSRLPVVLVLGPGGSTKTTIVTHSGLEPELLAGGVYQGESIAPTAAINLWYAQGTILLEAGNPVAGDDERWSRLLRHLQPSRWAAVLGRGAQAPRVAVICLSCDELLRPGSAEAIPATARKLRARLLEVSARLGIRLPVYVVFTKADRLPYFGDYLRSFTREEARGVLGATLPVAATAGVYHERESTRLQTAFQGIFRSLSLKRSEILARETQAEIRAGAYEFPRELRKASNLAIQFLLELGRPSQLGVNPFLRGFYFTGVRAVVLDDAESPAVPPAALSATPLDATGVFNASQLQAARAAAAPASRGRKVPEWAFLNRLFREVVLSDRTALGLTAGGTRVNLWRRTLLATATASLLLLSVGFTISYSGNRALRREAVAAVDAAGPIDRTGAGLPSNEVLQRLEPTRAQATSLRLHAEKGRPWRLGLGLYTGSDLLAELRRLYFDRFDPLLWNDTRSLLLASLGNLPEQPNETTEYGSTYDALKAHLITTSHPRESTAEFLTPTLLRYWPGRSTADDERLDLVQRQFDFFAAELRAGNPYDHRPDPAVIERSRIFLHRFADVEPVYQALVAEAGQTIEPIRFARRFPDAETVLRNDIVIPGAFTREGWTAIQAELAQVDRLFSREAWVVGERAIAPADRAKLAADLRARYVAEYLSQWRTFLEAATVVPFAGAGDAARKLARLSGNQSPLLQLLALISEETAVDSLVVGKAFAPVQELVPPGVTDRYIGDANGQYIEALAGLQSALAEAESATGPARADALGQAASGASMVEQEVRQLARSFSIEGEARAVGKALERLLLEPVTRSKSLVSALPAAELNTAGRTFCQGFQRLTAKYPFNARSTVNATPDEVAAVFQRKGSVLWDFYESALQEIVVPQGAQYVARPGADPRPAAEFLTFFNRAAGISRALYGESGSGPEVAFVLRPQTSAELPEVTITIDGQTQRFTRTFAAARTYLWKAEGAGGARIAANIAGVETTILEVPPGPWAVFRLFQGAAWERLSSDRYQVRWQVPGRSLGLEAELSFAGGVPLFMESHLGNLDCVSRVTR